MKKKNRNKIDIDIYSRSKYFLNLSRRSKNKQAEVEENKADLIIDKILGRDKVFNRDYAVFSYNNPAPYSLTPNRGNLHINPNIKLNIQSPSENAYPYKYQKKEFESDSFSNMYKNRNIKYLKSKFNNKKNKEQKNQKVNVNSEEDKFLGIVSNENKKKNNENNILITNQNYKINN